MASISHFAKDLPNQPEEKSFGPKSPYTFRTTSGFTLTTTTKAYAIAEGYILLQQQADINKVNLIIKPVNQIWSKVPIKYFIYRGLRTESFLNGTNLLSNLTTVKTSGSELLAKMQIVQQQRLPGPPVPPIPIQALFGDLVAPEYIDEIFTSQSAVNSQLFSIKAGTELGEFAVGEIGLDIILENPEFTPTIDFAKQESNIFDLSDIDNEADFFWRKELSRHFIDPAAFYGLHYDVEGGIEYRTGNPGTIGNAHLQTTVYDEIVSNFFTKNTIYLDIRNENGYSYNYYGNYIGLNDDENDSININTGLDINNLLPETYGTDEWSVHVLNSITGTGGLENTLYVSLRVADNKRPLMISQATAPDYISGTDQETIFTNFSRLLGLPEPTTLPEFTNPIGFYIYMGTLSDPYLPLATYLRIDYIKEIVASEEIQILRDYEHRTDFLFGPATMPVPLDVTPVTGVQWKTSNHIKYCDSLNQAIVIATVNEAITIASVDVANGTITVNQAITDTISPIVRLSHLDNSTFPDPTIISAPAKVLEVQVTGNQTTIKLEGGVPFELAFGASVSLFYSSEVLVTLDHKNYRVFAKGTNLTNSQLFVNGADVRLSPVFNRHNSIDLHIIDTEVVPSGTYLYYSPLFTDIGFGALMHTGIVFENTPSGEGEFESRVGFYAVPSRYYKKIGSENTAGIQFNATGGANKKENFLLDVFAKANPNFIIQKTTVQINPATAVGILEIKSTSPTKEDFIFLGISEYEYMNLQDNADAELSDFHIKMFKLFPISNYEISTDYKFYYKYKLHVVGYDSEGLTRKTTEFVDVYSTDGMLFTSESYSSDYVMPYAATNGCSYCATTPLTVAKLNSFMKASGVSGGISSTSTVNAYIDQLNLYMGASGINLNCYRRAHFLGQIASETGFIPDTENFNYRRSVMASRFNAKTYNAAKDYAWPVDETPHVTQENQIKIANIIYASADRAASVGNRVCPANDYGNPDRDGWKYRGRGLLQLTGWGNYTEFNTWYATYRIAQNLPAQNFVDNPDTVAQHPYTIISAIYYVLSMRGAPRSSIIMEADKGIDDKAINSVIHLMAPGLDQASTEGIPNIKRKLTKAAYNMLKSNSQCAIINGYPTNPGAIPNNNGIWRDPIDNPCITIYTKNGNKRPWRSAFGKVREDNDVKDHHGLDIFAEEDTNVLACMKGTIVSLNESETYGIQMLVKVDADMVPEFHKLRKTSYTLYDSDDVNLTTYYQNNGYDFESYIHPPEHPGVTRKFKEYEGLTTQTTDIYFHYAHLKSIVKAAGNVNPGDVIAKSGRTGKGAKGTMGPHLHFEIRAVKDAYSYGYAKRYNPAYYVNYKNEKEMTTIDKENQKTARNKKQK